MDYVELARKLNGITYSTDRLILRPFCDRDAEGLFELFHDENTMRMDGDLPILTKNEEFNRRISLVKEGPLIWLFAEEKNTSSFVGYVMLQDEEDAIALGFAITSAKQHMGYGHEFIGAILHILHEKGVKTIRIKTWEKNIPCQKLAESLGFTKTDTIENDHKDPLTGEINNSFLYILKC